MNFKHIFTTLCLSILFISTNVHASIQPQLPTQIENYSLDTSSVRFDSHCDPYLGENLCQEYWWAYYVGPDNKQVAVYLKNISDGISAYKQKIVAGKKIKVNAQTVYAKDGITAWILKDETSVGDFTFNNFETLEVETKTTSQGTSFNVNTKSKGNNPVTKYFITQYPSDSVVIKKEKKSSTKKMSIEITSPKKNEHLVAGEEYEIKWKSKNLYANSEILFQLMYNGAQYSFGTPVDNTGSYMWTVPAQYALTSSKVAPYKLVAYVTGTEKTDVYDYSDWFSIGFDKSDKGVIQPISINTHTENEVWKWGTSQTIQWRELNAVDSYTVTLVPEDGGKEKLIKKIKANKEPFVQKAKWNIDKKTQAGKYYWKIEGFAKKKLIAEVESSVFEIIE